MAGDAENTKTPVPSRHSQWTLSAVLVIAIIVLIGSNILLRLPFPEDDANWVPDSSLEAPQDPSFTGSTADLQRTIVVPTLETRVPEGKSAIWCATLAIAWQQVEKAVVKQRIELDGSELGRELGQIPLPDLSAKDYFTAAGYVKDGIIERIRREVSSRFPKARLPELSSPGADAVVAYAHLDATLVYEFEFKHSEKALHFRDSAGRHTEVHGWVSSPGQCPTERRRVVCG